MTLQQVYKSVADFKHHTHFSVMLSFLLTFVADLLCLASYGLKQKFSPSKGPYFQAAAFPVFSHSSKSKVL